MEDLSEADAKQVATAVKLAQKKKGNKVKGNIGRRVPFKCVLRGTRQDSQRIQLLENLLRHYQGLPRNSTYARHKIKMARKALDILTRRRKGDTPQDEKDLTELLGRLNIHDSVSKEMET
ncbi:hypothetical protein BSKO_08815 [Bryopsis sp. KO-2023]|nr:hypothetical protein BSKO_08815 [Bryopsis sp. KO-2023]